MRVHALLSWFDEDPDMLYDAVVSHADHCDTVIALDGRYALYPGSRDESSGEEYDAIADACRDARVPFLIQAPAGAWDGRWGGEVAKRAHLFRLAEQRSRPDDWYWIFDADFQVTEAFGDWRQLLEDTPALTAEVTLTDRRRLPHPVLFRALRGLTVTEHHWHYHVPGGPVLWDYEQLETQPRERETGEHISVLHRDEERAERRAALRKRYYRQRDRSRVEHDLDPRRRAAMRRAQHEHEQRLAALAHGVFASAVAA